MTYLEPMKGSPVKRFEKLTFPKLASTKIDGVRGTVVDGVITSCKGKRFPNPSIHELFSCAELEGLDGEITLGNPSAEDVCRKTMAALAKHEGTFAFCFNVFDDLTTKGQPFHQRLTQLNRRLGKLPKRLQHSIILLEHELLTDLDDLEDYERAVLEDGYEGVMLRDPEGPYKHGRSTEKEGWLLKVKRFQDAEAKVTGFVEEMHNRNEATTNELGRTKRSGHKANKTGKGRLGAFIGVDVKTGVEVRAGWLTDADKVRFWEHREELLGKVFTYKFFPHGVKDKARHSGFKCFRETFDF